MNGDESQTQALQQFECKTLTSRGSMRQNILITALAATLLCSGATFGRPNPPADRPAEQPAPMRERPQQDQFGGAPDRPDRRAPNARPDFAPGERGFQGRPGPDGAQRQLKQRPGQREFDGQGMRGG